MVSESPASPSEDSLMSTEIKSKAVIDKAIERLNELLPIDQAVAGDSDTILLGPDGRLDSMSFVNLLVAVDEELDRQFGVHASVADELGAKWAGSLTIQDLQRVIGHLIDRNKAVG